MNSFSLSQAQAVEVGSDAGWSLEFYAVGKDGTPGDKKASFGSSQYYASVDASLQDGFPGGVYSVKIFGLTDEDYAAITQSKPNRPTLAKLYLYWNDAISGPASYLGNLVGLSSGLSADDLKKALVAVLYVDSVKRSLGALTYDTEIHGVEWASYALKKPLDRVLEANDYRAAAAEIASRTHVDVTVYPSGAGPLTNAPESEKVSFAAGKAPVTLLSSIASALETNLNKHGRGMLLIRDGKIHLGPRAYPLEGDVKDLTPETGLLQTSIEGSSPEDASAKDSPERPHYTLLLKGRPDLKPGDLVRFDPPPGDEKTAPSLGAALLGAFAAPLLPILGGLTGDAVSVAVASVKHRLSREAGFSTEVRGVLLKDPTNAWDTHADPGTKAKDKAAPKADAGGDASEAIHAQLSSMTEGLRAVDVGAVRAFNAKTSDPAVPSQTLTAWEGLKREDLNANGTRRLAIDTTRGVRMDLPYATPFAWGLCGLVLPRYPGMRIVLAHRHGTETEAIDVGAFWDSGQGPNSEPGDYWLSLPRGVEQAKRDSASGDEVPEPYHGAATHDLIDADGDRVIEVGSLTIRIGAPDKLKQAGQRPEKTANSVVIEHTAQNARIEIDQNGKITLSGKTIELNAPDGDITLVAKNVNVKVSGAMNVQ